MFQLFITIQIILLVLGLMLLLYYSRMGENLNVDVILLNKKPRIPRMVKIYTFTLMLWLFFIFTELIYLLFTL